MKLGVSTASFFTKVPTEDTFEYIKDMGADVCEVFLSSHCEYSGELADKIVRSKTVPVNSIHAMTTQYEPELFNRNPRASSDANKILDRVLATGERLGAKYYTFHGATTIKKITYNIDYDRIAGIVNGISARCAAHGIRLSYETVHWGYFNNPAYFTELKQRCPDLYATMDIKQIMQSGDDWHDYLDVIGDRLTTVHLCDYDDNRRLYIPGRGQFDFVELFRELKERGFDGALIMEVYPEGYDGFDELTHSLEYLRECLDKI